MALITFNDVFSIDSRVGNFRVNSKEDISEALEALKDRPLYAEKWAYFKMVRRS